MRIKPKQGDQADWLGEQGFITTEAAPVQGNASARAFRWVQSPVRPQAERASQTPRQMKRALQDKNRNRGRTRNSNVSWEARFGLQASTPSVSQQASTPATRSGQSAPSYVYGQPAPVSPYLQQARGQSSQLPLPPSQPDAASLRNYLASLGPQIASLQPYLENLRPIPASHPPQQADSRVVHPAEEPPLAEDEEINRLDRHAKNHRASRANEQDTTQSLAPRGLWSSSHADTRSDYRAPFRHGQDNTENVPGLRIGSSTHTNTRGNRGGRAYIGGRRGGGRNGRGG